MKKTRLCILFGGRSSEYEVSLRSAYSVLTAADAEKYEIIPVGITREGAWFLYEGDVKRIPSGDWCRDTSALPHVTFDLTPGARSLLAWTEDAAPRRIPVDVVFPVLHGAYGEDGRIQGLLAAADIPFVGCDSEASAVCMDKAVTKSIVERIGVRQAECVVLHRAPAASCVPAVEAKLAYPVFVKPARAGSSVGVTKAKDRASLLTALDVAFAEDEKILVEETIVGREVETAVLEEGGRLTVSACAEIESGAEFYDYTAKYLSDTSRFYIPARIPDASADALRRAAAQIFTALGCATLSRVDFFVTDDGTVVFNEINTLPGFTSISMYPKLMMHEGMTYSALIDRLVASALANRR